MTASKNKKYELLTYEDNNNAFDFHFDTSEQGIWGTQQQISSLFKTDQFNVSEHISNIFNEDELDKESNMQFLHITSKPIKLYSLDMILSIGYRVNTKTATKFRKWSTNLLKSYAEQGYVLNEAALRASPDKLNKLAADVRAIRSGEQQVYSKVRECFKISASDYSPKSQEVRSFYALLQDKFHYAVTNMTSSKLIIDRADHNQDNMGLEVIKGKRPTKAEIKIGKNYLKKDEVYRLHLLSEQFLLFAESTALSGRKMTMKSLQQQLDNLLKLNKYPILDGYKDFLKDNAISHALMEFKLYKKRKKVESLGITYSEEDLNDGEYDHILSE